MLAKRFAAHGDSKAAHKLVTSHLRLVAKIAMGYRGYGLPVGEVISEGNIGLMQAVKKFEPDRGFRLATYAMWWIKASIQEYILRSWSLVKIGTTANQKKLFFNLRKAKSAISALDDGDLRSDQVKLIAEKLGVEEQEVIDMNRRLSGDASLNAPLRDDGDGSGEWQDFLVDERDNQESVVAAGEERDNRHAALMQALATLNARERRIIEARKLAEDPLTLEDLSAEFGVSRERVRQIEVRAFDKLTAGSSATWQLSKWRPPPDRCLAPDRTSAMMVPSHFSLRRPGGREQIASVIKQGCLYALHAAKASAMQDNTISPAAMFIRRLFFFSLVIATSLGLIALFAAMLAEGGFSFLDAAQTLLYAVNIPWSAIGVWTALIGFVVMRTSKDAPGAVMPSFRRMSGDEPITSSTAILMCIRNEEPSRVFRNVSLIMDGLIEAGAAHGFHLYLLSDTNIDAVARQEEEQARRSARAMRGDLPSPIAAAPATRASRPAIFGTGSTRAAMSMISR